MYKLVIVDDEEKIAEGIANLFPWEQLDILAVHFSKGTHALDYISNHDVDVLMSDIEMPDIDGIELCRLVSDKNIKVVLISSYQNYEYFRSAIQYKVEDYLLKPLKSSDILKCFGKIKEELDCENIDNKKAVINTMNYYEKIIDEVKQYIEEKFKEASLEDAAVLVNLSPGYLSRLFKDKCGFGFSDYLTKIRMEKAKELLNDFQYKSYDIAYYIGYDNPKNFSRAFKAYYGITPMEYRNSKGNEL